MKKTIVVAVALVFGLAAGVGIAAANKGPEEITLKTAEAKKPAKFPHAKHQATLKCADCHHSKGADGKRVPYAEGQAIGKCESCHNSSMANAELNNLKGVGHKLCKDCHTKKATEVNKPDLAKCDTCHPKQ